MVTRINKLGCGCDNQYGAANCHSDVARLRMTSINKVQIVIPKSVTDKQTDRTDRQTDRHEEEHRGLSDSVHSLVSIELVIN